MSEEFTVRKIAASFRISTEQALAYGLITEDEARANGWTAPLPTPWRTRLRWRTRAWWWQHKPRLHFGPCETGDE